MARNNRRKNKQKNNQNSKKSQPKALTVVENQNRKKKSQVQGVKQQQQQLSVLNRLISQAMESKDDDALKRVIKQLTTTHERYLPRFNLFSNCFMKHDVDGVSALLRCGFPINQRYNNDIAPLPFLIKQTIKGYIALANEDAKFIKKGLN